MLTMRNSADNMRMTYMPADVMQTTYLPADNVRMTFRMTYVICQLKSPMKSHSRVIRTSCGRRADDIHVMPGVVLHEIGQLRRGSHLEQLCIKPTGLLVNVFLVAIYFPKSMARKRAEIWQLSHRLCTACRCSTKSSNGSYSYCQTP